MAQALRLLVLVVVAQCVDRAVSTLQQPSKASSTVGILDMAARLRGQLAVF